MEGGGGATMTMDVIEEEEGARQQQQEVMARPPPPPPPPEQQMTRITTCEKHPDVPVIGLCALCLRERLVDLEASRRNNNNADSSSSASAILKSIFFRTSSSSNNNHNLNQQQQQHYYSQQQQQQQLEQRSSGGSSSVLLSQLRRCKSFSAGRRDGSYATPRASTSLEPQRRSCDVRGRNTLWSLFHQDDIDHHLHHTQNRLSSSSLFPAKVVPPTTSTSAGGRGDLETDRSRNLGFPPTVPVPESKEEEDDDDEEEEEEFEDAIGGKDDSTRHHRQWEKQEEEEEEENRNDTIGATKEDDKKEEKEKPTGDDEGQEEDMIVEEKEMDVGKAEEDEKARRNRNRNRNMEEGEEEPTTTTKKPPAKDLKEIAGSFWLAASVFSKKLRKWRQKQKLKKQQQQQQNNSSNKKHHQQDIYFSSSSSSYKLPSSSSLSSSSSLRPPRGSLDVMLPPEDPLVSLGRRSCDVIIAPPRFSLDAGRMSLDDPWDEPRASWDGYLLGGGGGGGGRSVFARQPHIFQPSFSDDNTVNANGIVQRSDDGLIPVEEDHLSTPGGALQAHDYYADFNRRGGGGAPARRSLERSNSIMLKRASEENGGGSARVSFELGAGGGANDPFHYSSTSLRGDDWSESFDSTSYNRDPLSTATTTTTTTKEECHTLPKKSRRRWSKAWNLWGFIHRGRSNDRGRRNAVGRSMSETWPHEFKVDHHNRRMLRSNSSSWRRSSYNSSMNANAAFGGLQSNCNGNGFHMDMNGGNHWHSSSKKRRDGSVFERNRSTRYSPANNADSNGMLRFYLPPMRSGRHGAKRSSVREGFGNPNAFPRSVLQLY